MLRTATALLFFIVSVAVGTCVVSAAAGTFVVSLSGGAGTFDVSRAADTFDIGGGPDQPPRAGRNVVVFISDDHGRDTGAYGNPVVQTPHLDALAAEGTLFTHAFATTASCSASRSVVLSGLHNHSTAQYGHEHDFHHFRSYERIRSLPQLLSEAGYRTASIGKYHVAPEEVYRFGQYLEGDSRSPVEMAENARAFIESEDDQPFFLYFATSDPHRGDDLEPDQVGRDWRDKMGAGTWSAAPGAEPRTAQVGPYPPNSFGNRGTGYPGITEVTYDPGEVIVPDWLPDTPATRVELAQYYQSISRIDQGFGYLVQILKDAGVYDETLIIYMSDHGIAMPGAKTTVYEPGLRSPLIVRHPDAPRRGIVSDAMISWVDITPTIVDFADVEPPVYDQNITNSEIHRNVDLPEEYGFHGRSFLPVLYDDHAAGWDEINASHTFHEIQMYYPMRVVRDRKYKLIWNVAHGLAFPFATDLWSSATWQSVYQEGRDAMYGTKSVRDYVNRPAFELYDMSTDPHESTNIAADPKYADVLEKYKARLHDFQVRTSDPWVLKWYYE